MKNVRPIKYIKEVIAELKKVTWPTKKEVFNHTIIVIVSSVVVMAAVAAIDYGLSYAVEYFVTISS